MQTTWRDIDWVAQYSDDAIVWVSVKKVDSLWKLDGGFYLESPLEGTAPEKYQGFGIWFSKNSEAVVMPHVFLLNGKISFSNGRNRFSWLRDRGVKALPVTTDPEEAVALRRAVGTRSRKSRIATHLIPHI